MLGGSSKTITAIIQEMKKQEITLVIKGETDVFDGEQIKVRLFYQKYIIFQDGYLNLKEAFYDTILVNKIEELRKELIEQINVKNRIKEQKERSKKDA